jgi:hypothetical protein
VALVDAFAGADYPGDAGGAPGVMGAAAKLLRMEPARALARVLMVEEDPAKVAWLGETLARLFPGEAPRRAGEALGALNLCEGLPEGVETLSGALEGSRDALVVLDPPAAGNLPLALVRGWLASPGTDLALRFPAADLRRLGRYPGVPVADLPLHLKRTVEGLSRFLGDARHGWLHAWTRSLEGGVEGAIETMARSYARRLGEAGGALVRRVDLPDGEAVDHFFLVTRRAARALLLNRVIHEMRRDGLLPWPGTVVGVVSYPPSAELGPPARGRRDRVVDRAQAAHSIAQRFAGRVVPVEEVLRSQAETDLFADDLKRALLELRRDGRALFRTLGSGAEITFAAPGARGMHGHPPRRRRRVRDELALALEGE